MKKVTATLLGLLILVLGTAAQTPTKAKKATPSVSVSLDIILSCAGDPYVQRVFKTDLATMRKLHIYPVTLAQYKDDADSKTLTTLARDTGFVSTGALSLSLDVSLMPYPPTAHPAFCAFVDAYYPDDTASSLPYLVKVAVSDFWQFNPNELFTHADQFTFTSGVFTNSTRVFFTARKGNVKIQFVPEPNGLRLDSVFITKPVPN